MTAEQILDIISSNYSEEAFAYENWFDTENEVIKEIYKKWQADPYKYVGRLLNEHKPAVLNYLGLGAYEVVSSYGGEGQGEKWYKVFHFTDHNVYIRIDGHYQSYNGTEFYSGHGREVFPKNKVVTFFE